jgi:D-xylose 1-dehydrogenase (NADP+, D-xylono-1,5-lactone-forming)
MSAERVEPVRWGILPVSGIAARAFMPAVAASTNAKAVAVASRERAKAAGFAATHGIAQVYGSYAELLADRDVEAVYISLPNSGHVEWTIRALEAGKHVLCEKPLDSDPENVARAFDAAHHAKRLLMEAFMYRHHPDTAQLQACIAGGELGEIHTACAALSFTMPGTQNIRLSRELDGGALMDVGCYAISGLRILAGEPERVSGVGHLGPTDVDLRFTGFMQHRSGVTTNFDCGLDLPSRSVIEVTGTRGTLRAIWPFFRPFFPHIDPPMIEVRLGLESRRLPLTDANAYLAQLDNFSRAIRGLERPRLGREDACAQASVIAALRRSAAHQSAWTATGL